MKTFFTFSVLLFVFALGACKKPILETGAAEIPPLVLSTSIYDSLPDAAIKKLHLTDVTGMKFKYHTGKFTCYFEYSADKKLVLQVLSELPFPIDISIADSTCKQISLGEMGSLSQHLSRTEVDGTSSFWNVSHNVEVFECIKPPFRHIVQISPTKKVLHRIEFIG
jgi:hypothetical protein